MWGRFTELARTIIFYAQEEASRLGTSYVITEHILLGILRTTESAAYKILESIGVSAVTVRSMIVNQLQQHVGADNEQEMQLTSRAKQIIDIASAESKNTGSQIISSTHLLLGILKQENSIAANVLMQLGVDVDKVRAKAEDIRETERSNSIPNPFRNTPIMRPQIVSILEDIVKEYGVAVYKDRERCENLLWERRGDFSREVVALQLILKIGVVDDLASSINGSNFNTLTMSAVNKATDLLPIDNGCAIQAIMAWVKALKLYEIE